MKYLNPIKGIIVWTWNCLEVWASNLKEVITVEPTYWSQTQTFFHGKTAEKDRKAYREAEKKLFEEFIN